MIASDEATPKVFRKIVVMLVPCGLPNIPHLSCLEKPSAQDAPATRLFPTALKQKGSWLNIVESMVFLSW